MIFDYANGLVEIDVSTDRGETQTNLTFKDIADMFAKTRKCQYPHCPKAGEALYKNKYHQIIVRCAEHIPPKNTWKLLHPFSDLPLGQYLKPLPIAKVN